MQQPIFKIEICLLLTLTSCHGSNSKNIDIFRGARDRFTNIVGCSKTNAVCFDKNCTYCQCMMDQTYVYTRGQYGKCIENELMVYATSYEDSFLLQNLDLYKFCPSTSYNTKYTFVLGTSCRYKNWIWTNFGQLLNWQTLECMTDDHYVSSTNKYFVTIRKCDRNNQKQLWECVGDKIQQTQSGRYMYYGEYNNYVTTKNTHASVWTRFGSKKDVCSQAVGCETFADSSSLLILDKTKCEEQSECSGEKEINFNKTKCFLLPNKTQYLHNDTWKALEIKNGSFAISVDKVSLQWNLNRPPKSWKGLLVKVQFQCESETTTKQDTTTEHCVVIKYMGTFTGFNYNEEDVYPNNNTQIIIIIVCVLVLFCIAGVIGIIVYKRRNRSVRSKNRNTENPVTDPIFQVTDQDSSPVVQELAKSANPSRNNSQPAPRQSQLYIIPKQEHEYEYVYANDRTFGLQPRSQKYELPQSTRYEYPEQPQSHQYEYPSIGELQLKNGNIKNVREKRNKEASTTGKTDVGVMDGEYTALVRPPLNNNENDDSGYAHLNNVQRGKEEAGATERMDKPDGLLNGMDGEYTPLVRPSLKNECEDSGYTPLINGQKRSEEAGAREGKDEADELLYVGVMDGEYTRLARPSLKTNESEAPRYAPLIKK